jgi:hypothetical protein
MSMCNNDVTYHEKWDTLENNAALKKLDEKFFDRSICSPHCPPAWAPEVLEMLEHIDQKFGIKRNTSTIRAYRISNTMFELFVKATYNNVTYALFKEQDRKGNKYSLKERLSRAKEELFRTLTYARKAFMVKHVNGIINRALKPQVELSQIKEKYGYLTLYFHCENAEYKEYINKLVKETTIKLATKGAYYPLETIKKADAVE